MNSQRLPAGQKQSHPRKPSTWPGFAERHRKAALASGLVSPTSEAYGWNTIVPNVPAWLLLGPAAKYRWLAAPFFPSPSPKSIPHSWSITIAFSSMSFTVPINRPEIGSNALIVPRFVLFEISSVLLSGPKLRGAAAMPHG